MVTQLSDSIREVYQPIDENPDVSQNACCFAAVTPIHLISTQNHSYFGPQKLLDNMYQFQLSHLGLYFWIFDLILQPTELQLFWIFMHEQYLLTHFTINESPVILSYPLMLSH